MPSVLLADHTARSSPALGPLLRERTRAGPRDPAVARRPPVSRGRGSGSRARGAAPEDHYQAELYPGASRARAPAGTQATRRAVARSARFSGRERRLDGTGAQTLVWAQDELALKTARLETAVCLGNLLEGNPLGDARPDGARCQQAEPLQVLPEPSRMSRPHRIDRVKAGACRPAASSIDTGARSTSTW